MSVSPASRVLRGRYTSSPASLRWQCELARADHRLERTSKGGILSRVLEIDDVPVRGHDSVDGRCQLDDPASTCGCLLAIIDQRADESALPAALVRAGQSQDESREQTADLTHVEHEVGHNHRPTRTMYERVLGELADAADRVAADRVVDFALV